MPTPPKTASHATASIMGVQDALVRIRQNAGAAMPLMKNEVVYILPPANTDGRSERLMAEILRIRGDTAEAQVFEPTGGIGIGDEVEQSGEQLSITLGPGLLGMVYDGLQNPLKNLAEEFGTLLPRGIQLPPLDMNKKWPFTPSGRVGDTVYAGDVLGTVPEGRLEHRIMVPFDAVGAWTIKSLHQGDATMSTVLASLENDKGGLLKVHLAQRWPVRRPLSEALLKSRQCARVFPSEPLVTTLRMIDTFFPIARGGTACIPGPFGAGKTVLQNLIARYSDVDIVLVVACGERAGEVVETIQDFPKLNDPRTGGTLMDRTIIVCNTSSMPVAAREASVYTGVTLGEYYRQMGYNVLLIADSTSRWAQAMRETSGRMEEIPGEEGFPAYLDSAIRGLYERAGIIQSTDGRQGSLTLIGTVSPAGGNFEEPVTQSTLGTVKTFLGLSYDRAYKRFYPAIDPLLSWSRYREQLSAWFEKNLGAEWTVGVLEAEALLKRGEAVARMMQVTGEEGTSVEDYFVFQKARLLDMVYLQQDAFDAVDVSVSPERQREVFAFLLGILRHEYRLTDRGEIQALFNKITSAFKNMNYAAFASPDYKKWQQDIRALMEGA